MAGAMHSLSTMWRLQRADLPCRRTAVSEYAMALFDRKHGRRAIHFDQRVRR